MFRSHRISRSISDFLFRAEIPTREIRKYESFPVRFTPRLYSRRSAYCVPACAMQAGVGV